MKSSTKSRWSSWGFTLTEILVVLAILTILIALLIPAFRSVQESAFTTKCSANLKSIAVAGQAYAHDNNGEFTSITYHHALTDTNSAGSPTPGFRAYLGFEKRVTGVDTILTCPSLQKTHLTTNYAFNHNYGVNAKATTYKPGGGKEWLRGLRSWANVETPSQMSYFMDGVGTPGSKGYVFSDYYSTADRGKFHYPHRSKQQVLFLDGHIALMTAEDIAAIPDDDPFWTGRKKH